MVKEAAAPATPEAPAPAPPGAETATDSEDTDAPDAEPPAEPAPAGHPEAVGQGYGGLGNIGRPVDGEGAHEEGVQEGHAASLPPPPRPG